MAPTRSTDPTHVRIACADLDAATAFYTGDPGFRLDMVMPADAPRMAVLSGHGITLHLQQTDASGGDAVHPAPDAADPGAPRIQRAGAADAWGAGRAGMQYRDLVPGRMGGRFIASHIRIPGGGPVPDYVHYHRVDFQLIYCRRGWVRVVYEDQGPPFVMQAGDCILQPPAIRHRVLEASSGLEVIEAGSPAEHETWRDHDLVLPTDPPRPQRLFGSQPFVRHVAADAHWQPATEAGFEFRDTGIEAATGGRARVRVLRAVPGHATVKTGAACMPMAATRFLFVLEGRMQLQAGVHGTVLLETDDACLVPAGTAHALHAVHDSEILEVCVPSRPH